MSHPTHAPNGRIKLNRNTLSRFLRRGSWKLVNLLVVMAMLLPNFTFFVERALAAGEDVPAEQVTTAEINLSSLRKADDRPLTMQVQGQVAAVQTNSGQLVAQNVENWQRLLSAPSQMTPPEGVDLHCAVLRGDEHENSGNQNMCEQLEDDPYLQTIFQVEENFHPNYFTPYQQVAVECDSVVGCEQVPVYFSLACNVEWQSQNASPKSPEVLATIRTFYSTTGPAYISSTIGCDEEGLAESCAMYLDGVVPGEQIGPKQNNYNVVNAEMEVPWPFYMDINYDCDWHFSLTPIHIPERSGLNACFPKSGSGDARECTLSSYKDSQGYVGDPINTLTGGFDYSIVDLSLPTTAGDLVFQHTYSSLATELYTTTMGFGWTHNHDTRLIFSDDPQGEDETV